MVAGCQPRVVLPPGPRAAPPVLALSRHQPGRVVYDFDTHALLFRRAGNVTSGQGLVPMSDSAAKWAVPETAPAQPAQWRDHTATVWRYALSIFGPVSVSGAHFVASIMFLRELPPADFGLLAFLLVVVPFICISVG